MLIHFTILKQRFYSRLRIFLQDKRFRQFHYTRSINMPLVVPGVNNTGSKTEEWMNKLVGKKIGEQNDSVTFAKAELPKETRVIQPGQMVTKDFNPERLNVHLGEDGTVTHVDHQ